MRGRSVRGRGGRRTGRPTSRPAERRGHPRSKHSGGYVVIANRRGKNDKAK
jgi:hypothetical protein